MSRIATLLTSILIAAGGASASALSIQMDYSYDQAATNFFGTHPVAKAAMDKAAADLSAALGGGLGAVPTDRFTGLNGSTSATFDWALTFPNPSVPGTTVTLQNFSFPADTIIVYAGMRLLSGTTLGEGGSFGAGFSGSADGGANLTSLLPGAVASAQQTSNAVMRRGSGPLMGSISGSFNSPGTNYTLTYGAMVGTLWMDDDTNNDGLADSDSVLNSFWHFDATTSVTPGKSDFYSVALHEMLHAIGFAASQTWTELRTGSDWLGVNARALNGGSGTGLLSADGSHIRSDLQSPRLANGALQEVVMDPSLTVGTRKTLTQMDVAFLRDLGYATVPEPSCGLVILTGALGLFGSRPKRRG